MAIVDISGVSVDALNMVDMMDGILERVVSIFESYAVPLPARRYWTVGQSAIDCEQLTLALVQGYLGRPGDQQSQPQKCNMPRSAVVLVTVAREIPTVSVNGRPPTAQSITDGAKIGAVDAWVLLQSLNLMDQWDGTGFGMGVIASVDIPPPEGGFQLVTMTLTLAIP
jgi:hypothetical protein